MTVLKEQYEWIRQTREALFAYCERINHEDYIRELENFGGWSMRKLHAHVVACYQVWLGHFAMKSAMTIVNPDSDWTVQDMRQLFTEVDDLVFSFINTFKGKWDQELSGPVPWKEGEEALTALWLYTHTLTHEFHHKGQLVSISRQLGYIPEDTDLIAPSHI
ncbi:putative damage-inducible protein DinB [Pullulanibacillus pueri]|uniref:DNA damage-inducible protein DinB n=1 Tax=Pullulanibacillus pueri TaxID=1437324 RepID=A0A8J2ZWI0_9BACL|nr:DinB family protein [Pullulanibacillus pueri]MBM7682565.1 putative damage-inducible protein DinB [Pullulanibacillus pueri]GGH82321.1 DNA damage-inducible protein DinB [Pullulanibacillus pueri]